MQPYYSQNGITIYLGDCREILPLLSERPALVLTDPPYTEEVHANSKRVYASGIVPFIDFPSFDEADLRTSFDAIGKVSGGWVISFLAFEHTVMLKNQPPVGLEFTRAGVWFKPNTAPHVNQDRPSQGWESIAMLHAMGVGKHLWHGTSRKRNHSVFTYNICGGGLHTAQKPQLLMQELIELFSNPGDYICDPFMGSGTTLAAAKLLGRRAVGIEINEAYAEIAARRLQQEVMDLTA